MMLLVISLRSDSGCFKSKTWKWLLQVIAKGEAQGMVSKSVGIALGIALSSYVGSSGPLLVYTFVAVTGLHIFCNLKSYQAVQLRTLNPYRASKLQWRHRSRKLPWGHSRHGMKVVIVVFQHLWDLATILQVTVCQFARILFSDNWRSSTDDRNKLLCQDIWNALLMWCLFGAGLVLAEYFKSNKVATVKEVNGEEPIFPNISFFNFRLRGSKVQVLNSCL